MLCPTLLLKLFPDSRASLDQMNDNKVDKFWALHTFQYLEYKAKVAGEKLHLIIMPHSFVHKFKSYKINVGNYGITSI